MKILRYLSVIVFFQFAGFLISIPVLSTSLFLGDYFGILSIFLTMVIPAVIVLGLSLFISSRFNDWMKYQSEKKQLLIGAPLIAIFAVVITLETVVDREPESVFDSIEKTLSW